MENNIRRINRKNIIITIIAVPVIAGAIYLWVNIFIPALTVGLILATLITQPSPTPQPLPCGGKPESTVELGSPTDPPAEFTTAGGQIFITARDFFTRDGLFDIPGKRSTAIYIGLTSNPPIYDLQRNTVSNTAAKISIKEKEYGQVNLAPGRYWLFASNGKDILLVSCSQNGVSDPLQR